MSVPGFTPGPLSVAGPSTGKGRYDDGGDYAIMDSSGHIIGEAFRVVAHALETPAHANARLWAAAPDLHTFAEAVAAHFADTDAPLGERARALLTKITPPVQP